MNLEWTDQHGCGGNEDTDPTKQNCVLVLQYLCQPKTAFSENSPDRLRDGLNTQTQDYTRLADDTLQANQARKQNDVKLDRVLQESWEYYDNCANRNRNKGLFTADQSLRGDGAIYTRQNPNGNRNGYECPEERDYYPYWHPQPWKDAAILTSNMSLCEFFRKESFNVKPKHQCVEYYDSAGKKTPKHFSKWNNEADCVKNSGRWVELYSYLDKVPQYGSQAQCESQSSQYFVYKWAVPYDSVDFETKQCLVLSPAPECGQATWTRSNHLGNGRDGVEAPGYKWRLPYFPSKRLQKCVFRIRYNVSTDDYDGFGVDASLNKEKSPIKTNPLVDVGVDKQTLRLAINTAQFGRVFQDRSHSFFLLPRPGNLKFAFFFI